MSDPATKKTVVTKSQKYKHSEGVICTQCVKIAVAKVRGVAAPHRAHAGFCPRKQQKKLLSASSAQKLHVRSYSKKKRQKVKASAASHPLGTANRKVTPPPDTAAATRNSAPAIVPPSLPAERTKTTYGLCNRQPSCAVAMSTHSFAHPWCMPQTTPWLQPPFLLPWWIPPGMHPQLPQRQICCWSFAQWREKRGRKGRPPHDATCCTKIGRP